MWKRKKQKQIIYILIICGKNNNKLLSKCKLFLDRPCEITCFKHVVEWGRRLFDFVPLHRTILQPMHWTAQTGVLFTHDLLSCASAIRIECRGLNARRIIVARHHWSVVDCNELCVRSIRSNLPRTTIIVGSNWQCNVPRHSS